MFEQLGEKLTIGGILLIGAEVLALISVANALMSTRSATGAWGWVMSLLAFPFLAVPAYWVFGRREFNGYGERRKEALQKKEDLLETLISTLEPHYAKLDDKQEWYGGVLSKLSERRYTRGNEISLLKDGHATFDEIFRIIDSAEDYLLVQFFILKADQLGERLRLALINRAKAGVRIYLLYDEIGSYGLPKTYINSLREGGVAVRAFHSTQGRSNRFQINFRNHRKMVLADGVVGTCGGHNVGNEYLGVSRIGNWRDTTVRISGPAAMSLQMVFLEDWYWAAREIPDFNWTQPVSNCCKEDGSDDMTVLVLPFGPVEHIVEGGTLYFLNAISRAKERIWIASPYFVPDHCIVSALQLASLRGVDVRIMIPSVPDKWTPYLASFSFLEEMEVTGVRVLRYGDGFMHQKAVLVDHDMASVGTANLDNRSMRLNFEVNIVVMNRKFCDDVEAMFLADFEQCKHAPLNEYRSQPWWFRIGVKLARLAAPVL
ncbi:MAG: cardiolipin synthase [Verrucomicrobiales bacterium]|nr:cardiolipin synthase [Verrucomicrobiales bacterium]